MNKIRVAVLKGGPSEEYDISLKTGVAILEALNSPLNNKKYHPIDVHITKNSEWIVGGYVRTPEAVLTAVDVVFLALHGTYGEDGSVQRLLDTFNIPYIGSKSFGSAVALNKVLTKNLLQQHNIQMPRHMNIDRSAQNNLYGIVESLSVLLGDSFVIKPVRSGSSIGVTIAHNKAELLTQLSKALQTYDEVLVEEYISGTEATCAVLNNFRGSDLYSLPVVEIVPPQGSSFFDYETKYNGETDEICPARFTTGIKKEIESLSKLVHKELGLSQYSRSDFMVANDAVYFLEVNTLPGLTPQSLLPVSLDAIGCTYESFIDHLLTDALNR